MAARSVPTRRSAALIAGSVAGRIHRPLTLCEMVALDARTLPLGGTRER
jgi:hypothetical protein